MSLTDDLAKHPDEITIDGFKILVHWYATYTTPAACQANAWNIEHGHCINLQGFRNLEVDTFAELTVGQQWRHLEDRVVEIDGILEEDIPAGIELLLETGRAWRAHRAARKNRADRTRQMLTESAAKHQECLAAKDGSSLRAREDLDYLAVEAINDHLLDFEEIITLCQYTKQSADYIQMRAETSQYRSNRQPPLYLDADQVAARYGIELGSLDSAISRGSIPQADLKGRYWDLSKLEAHKRPGRGRRTDLLTED